MAQSGYTPISLYYSTTAAATPTSGNLTSGELAINITDGKLFYKDNGGTVQTIATKDAASGSFASLSVTSGNLAFTSTAQRITGDFSNATVANRLTLQSSTTNGNTNISAIPNGTGVNSSFNVFNNSDPNNASFGQLLVVGSTDVRLQSSLTGTGTYLPMTFYTGGSERVRIDTSGNVGIGGSPSFALDVQRTSANAVVNIQTTTSGNATLQLLNAGNATSTITQDRSANNLIITNGSSGSMTFVNNGSERMRIDASGNVGIGTASPGALFDVGGGGLRVASTGAMTSGNLADAVGYKGTPLNEQSAAYTLVIGDMGKSIVHPASDNNARTFTIPANSSVAFPVGTTITFINMINTVTIAITTDTMYLAGSGSTGSRTLAAYGMATAVKMTSTTWIISGNGLT